MTRVNEGFWDSVVNSAKRGAHAVGATLGSGSSAGKLSALNLSTKFYDEWKYWLGSTGSQPTPESMQEFIENDLEMSPDFAAKASTEFQRFLNNPDTYPNAAAEGAPKFKTKPSDSQLRKYFLNVSQKALKSGVAKTAARAAMQGGQEPDRSAGQEAPQSSSNDAQTSSQPDSPSAPGVVNGPVDLGNINLDDNKKKLLYNLENGGKRLSGLIKADDPEVQALASRILDQALANYKTSQEEKRKRRI